MKKEEIKETKWSFDVCYILHRIGLISLLSGFFVALLIPAILQPILGIGVLAYCLVIGLIMIFGGFITIIRMGDLYPGDL